MPSKILFITRGVPYPPIGGASLRNWHNISVLSSHHTVGVLSINKDNSRLDVVPEALPGVAFFRYFPDGQKTWLIRKLWNTGIFQKFILPVVKCVSPAGIELQRILQSEFDADVLIFGDYPKYWDLFNFGASTSRPVIVYDAHNIESALHEELFPLNRSAQQREPSSKFSRIRGWLRELNQLWLVNATERALILNAAQTWVCSNEDDKKFRERYGSKSQTFLVPNVVDVEHFKRPVQFELPRELRNSTAKQIILFPAKLNYLPNELAAIFLIEKILPELFRILPDCRMFFVGAEPTDYLLQCAKSDPRITVTGAVHDIRPYFWSASALVAPIQVGGGTRLKILEAFAATLPVVSTTKGAEGLDCSNLKHLLIADSPVQIIDSLVRILTDKELSESITSSALQFVSERFSREALDLIFGNWKLQKISLRDD